MYNPYLPNTAQIPNILFDYWMQRLSHVEFKVLMAIARKTYGWQKKRDRISLSQLTSLTGAHKSAVIRCTEVLIEYGLVTKFKSKDEFDGSDAPNQYEINLDAIEKEGGVSSCDTPLVASCDPPPVASCDTQNPLSTKPNDDDDAREKTRALDWGNVHNSTIELVNTYGEKVTCTSEEYFRHCVNKRKDFSIQEVSDAWKKLERFKGSIGDWKKYLDQIIDNAREDEKRCNLQTKNAKNEKKESRKELKNSSRELLAKDTSAQVLPDSEYQELLKDPEFRKMFGIGPNGEKTC